MGGKCMVLNGKTIAVQYFQLRSAQLIKSSVYRVLHTTLSSRICEHFGVQFKLGTTGSICFELDIYQLFQDAVEKYSVYSSPTYLFIKERRVLRRVRHIDRITCISHDYNMCSKCALAGTRCWWRKTRRCNNVPIEIWHY